MTSLIELFGAGILGAAVAAGLLLRHIKELKKLLEKKERAIAQTSKLLIDKNIELFDQNVGQQKQLASKDDFVAIASHQLRTPAAEIKWGVGALLDQLEPASPMRNDLLTVMKSAEKMESLIEDLLQFVTVEQDQTHRAVSSYNPETVVAAAVARTAKDFSTRPVAVSTSFNFSGTIKSIDPNALDMIVSNLLENAYHYTPDHGKIAVCTSRNTEQFEVVIEDSGVGVPLDMRDKLFVKFRRASKEQGQNIEGSGLGLYIVKTVLDRVGGSVHYAPREGGGSVFSFKLPT